MTLPLVSLSLAVSPPSSPPSSPNAFKQLQAASHQTSSSRTETDGSEYAPSSSDATLAISEHAPGASDVSADATHRHPPRDMETETLPATADPSKKTKQIIRFSPPRQLALLPRPSGFRPFQREASRQALWQLEAGPSRPSTSGTVHLNVLPLAWRSPFQGVIQNALPTNRRYHSWWLAYQEAHAGPWPKIFGPRGGTSSANSMMEYKRYVLRIHALDTARRNVLGDRSFRLSKADFFRLKRGFHPWKDVPLKDLRKRAAWYQSLIEAEKEYAKEVEGILERVGTGSF